MEIREFIGEKFSKELRQHFNKMAALQKVPLDLMRDKPNQEVMARFLLGELADVLTEMNREDAYLDGAVYMMMLHVLGSETIADILDGGKTTRVPSADGVDAFTFDIGEEGEPPRQEVPKVEFRGLTDGDH